MSKKELSFKEKSTDSCCKFVKMLSIDTKAKKRFDKAIYLYFALIRREKMNIGLLERYLTKTFGSDDVYNKHSNLIMNKYIYYDKTFEVSELKTSWFIKLKHFEWVTDFLEDKDYIFFPDKYNQGQFIKEEEFRFLAFKLTEVLVRKKGYNTITRSFFLNKEKSVYKDYLKHTGRRITRVKLAYMTNVLSERDIVYRYRRPNKANLFVIGNKNPYYQLSFIITDNDISNIYTKYHIDTTDHFIRQSFGKNLIPGKKEKEFRKEKREFRKKNARDKAIQREIDKQERKKLVAFNERGISEKEPEVYVKNEAQNEMEQIINDIQGRE